MILKDMLAEEGRPFKTTALNDSEFAQRVIAPVKAYKTSQRAKRTGILELAWTCQPLRRIRDTGENHDYCWEVLREETEIELVPRNIETWELG